jgi:hypothetical protein
VRFEVYLEDAGADGMIILNVILKKLIGMAWTGLKRLRKGTSGALL